MKKYEQIIKHPLFKDHIKDTFTMNLLIGDVYHTKDCSYCNESYEHSYSPTQFAASASSSWFYNSYSRKPPAPPPQNYTVSYEDVLSGKACPNCALEGFRAPGHTQFYGLLEKIISASNSAKSLGKTSTSPSAASLQRRRLDVNALIGEMQTIVDGTSRDDVKALAEKAIASLQETKRKLDSFSRDPETLKKLERKVQNHLVPKKFRDQEFELDSTMKLIGISPAPSYFYGDAGFTVKAIIESYSIRNDTRATVLYAPAYFYSFLLAVLCFRKGNANFETLVVSANAPEDPTVRETTAFLWDPQQATDYACLSKALSAGEALA